MSTLFETQYKRLTKAQKDAVNTIEGPVMVIAGPGTGKTTVLTLRIANILKTTDTPASGILALTFTEAGVKAMRLKLRALIGSRADEVRIHTFHGFASSVINEHREHFIHLARSVQMNDLETEIIIRNILEDIRFRTLRPLGDPDFYIRSIISTISNAKKEALTPEMVAEYARVEMKAINADEESYSTRGATKGQLKGESLKRIEKCEKTILFADIYTEYEARKKAEKKYDFDDLIFEFLHTLKTDELLLQIVQESFLYVLLDEHQDTNDAQNAIVKIIVDFFDTPNLFVVGDEKQAIYRFQGASVENFVRFQTLWNSMKIISLADNFRSHQNILDASFKMIENNYEAGQYEHLRVKLNSGSKLPAKPLLRIDAGNTEALEECLVKNIQDILAGDKEDTVALIVRKNTDVVRLMALCERSGIPAKAERGVDVFSHPIGIIFFDLIEYLATPSRTDLLAKTVASGLWDIDFSTMTKLVKELRGGITDSVEALIPKLKELLTGIDEETPLPYLLGVANTSGLMQKIVKDPLSSEVWRTIMALAFDIAKRTLIQSPRVLIEELLVYKKGAEEKKIKLALGIEGARVEVMTAHSSKGLEYDYVFLPYLTEESWSSGRGGSSFVLPYGKDADDQIKDTRRLLYVAITRARKHVTMLHSRIEGAGRELTPLRFIDELETDLIETITLPASNTIQGADGLAGTHSQASKITEFTKTALIEKGLSVTALNNFLTCPSLFLYNSILKLPQAPNVNSEKGTIMHLAFDRVWNSSDRGEKEIIKTIEETVSEQVALSLLSPNDKKFLKEELVTDAPAVASALLPHFATTLTPKTETWVDRLIPVKDSGESFDLKIHGKLDALLESADGVQVFDYKTKRGMSEKAIRGETSSEDGNYFRQLVFYRLLLEGDRRYKNKSIETSLVFIRPDDKGRCPIVTLPITEEDKEKVLSEVQSLVDSVWSGEFVSKKCDEPECQWCKLKNL